MHNFNSLFFFLKNSISAIIGKVNSSIKSWTKSLSSCFRRTYSFTLNRVYTSLYRSNFLSMIKMVWFYSLYSGNMSTANDLNRNSKLWYSFEIIANISKDISFLFVNSKVTNLTKSSSFLNLSIYLAKLILELCYFSYRILNTTL
jgi:hypothetical protein